MFTHNGFIEWDSLPSDVQAQYLADGQGLKLWHINDNGGLPSCVWTKRDFDTCVDRAKERKLLPSECMSYDADSVMSLYAALDKYSIQDKDVAVMGSWRPWVETICLGLGARTVTTVDYNIPNMEQAIRDTYPLKTMTVSDANQSDLKYDMILSYSSMEHDGLGRYGDPINPEGDIACMEAYKRLLKPEQGVFLLGVPVGEKDELVFNAHRIYGPARLPRLLQAYNVKDIFTTRAPNGTLSTLQPVFGLNPNNTLDSTFHPWICLSPRS